MTQLTLINKYLEKIEIELRLRDCSKRTVDSYIFFLKPFLEKIETPESVTIEQTKNFLAGLIDKYSNKSRASKANNLHP